MFGLGNNGQGEQKAIQELLNQLKQEDSVVRAQLNDQRLFKLAEYDVTQGYMKVAVTPDDLQGKFNELKRLVMKGSFTLKDLEDDVYKRWGIQEPSRDEYLGMERGKPKKEPIGFAPFTVADIPEDSPLNH